MPGKRDPAGRLPFRDRAPDRLIAAVDLLPDPTANPFLEDHAAGARLPERMGGQRPPCRHVAGEPLEGLALVPGYGDRLVDRWQGCGAHGVPGLRGWRWRFFERPADASGGLAAKAASTSSHIWSR